jgi:hypothetical protein
MGSVDFLGFSRGSGQTGILAEQIRITCEQIEEIKCKK